MSATLEKVIKSKEKISLKSCKIKGDAINFNGITIYYNQGVNGVSKNFTENWYTTESLPTTEELLLIFKKVIIYELKGSSWVKTGEFR